MDLDKYINKYTNVSRGELEKMVTLHFNTMSESGFDHLVWSRHRAIEREKKNGRAAIRTRPLVQVLSVNLQPKNENKNSPLIIYGKIYAETCESGVMEMHELFNRERDVGEILGTSNELSLIGPEFSCRPPRTCTPLSWINVMLYDGDDNIFAKEHYCLNDDQFEDDYEEVKCRLISCVQGSLLLKYILIPFGVNCCINVQINDRHFGNKHLNVNGKIAVRYGNTYGNCFEEECVIFEKQGIDFERAEFKNKTTLLKIPRSWVASPAYSPLVVIVDLSEFGTGRKIIDNTIELLPDAGLGSGESFLQEEMGLFIKVEADWFQPDPFGLYKSPSLLGIFANDIEEMNTDGEDESSDESSDEECDDDLSSNPELPWSLHPHKDYLWPSPAVEIFSVFIGREKSKAIQIHGSIEVLIDDEVKYHIFKREEKDAMRLQEYMNTTPILEGSRRFEDCSSLGIRFDIKDVDDRLAIKGFLNWHSEVLDAGLYHEKLLCSSILGKNGFAAVHYSIFSNAIWANIKVYLNLKKGVVDVYPKVSGSLITQYSCYDYSTRYNKDYYRIVLFKRSYGDSVELSSNTIPLSRSMVVVPSYSSLVVDVDLSFGDSSGQMLSCAESIKFKINEGGKTKETDDYSLRIELDWCEIK